MGNGHNFLGLKSRTLLAGLAAQERRNLDRFAELLSEHDLKRGDPGGDIVKTARRMGIDPNKARGMFRRITNELGGPAHG